MILKVSKAPRSPFCNAILAYANFVAFPFPTEPEPFSVSFYDEASATTKLHLMYQPGAVRWPRIVFFCRIFLNRFVWQSYPPTDELWALVAAGTVTSGFRSVEEPKRRRAETAYKTQGNIHGYFFFTYFTEILLQVIDAFDAIVAAAI